ncbi:ABC transporter substrate-binding protein [Streptomyces sp. NPDC093252]|uniref:ABC transporter substrate-binding protein n=1 Tax=Streptomyces sp. NPDC093252 TaxID=3154980 RepID=UPI003428E40E
MQRLFAGIAAVALLLGATACGASADSDSSASESGGVTRVNVGVIPIVDVAALYLGKEQGIYEKHGLDLSMTTAQGGSAIVPGVVSGQFQFGFSNTTSLMVAQSNGVQVKAVSNGVATTGVNGEDYGGLVVQEGSPIKSAKDLEGRTVAVNTLKNILDTSVRESVRKDGGDPSKVKFVELAFDQMPAALDKGQIDAAMAVEPALTTILEQGGVQIASPYADVAEDLTVAMYFTSQEYAQQNPEVVEKFQQATAEALAYANSHPDEVRDIVATYTEIPASVLSKVTLPKWPEDISRSSVERLEQLGQQDGLFKTAPDLDELLP